MVAPYQVNSGSFNLREPSGETLLSNGTLSVQQNLTVVGAQTGTTGTLMHLDLDPAYYRTPGFQPRVLLKATIGDTILVKHSADNIILKDSTDYVLTGEKVLEVVRFVATTTAVVSNKFVQPG